MASRWRKTILFLTWRIQYCETASDIKQWFEVENDYCISCSHCLFGTGERYQWKYEWLLYKYVFFTKISPSKDIFLLHIKTAALLPLKMTRKNTTKHDFKWRFFHTKTPKTVFQYLLIFVNVCRLEWLHRNFLLSLQCLFLIN